MFYEHGNPPITSTQGIQTNPSTADLIAEITGLGGPTGGDGKLYEGRVLIGGSTSAQYWVEQCLSSGLGSTALRGAPGVVQGGAYLGRRILFAATNQTAQYMLRFRAESGDRIRVRVEATMAGNCAATLQVEVVP